MGAGIISALLAIAIATGVILFNRYSKKRINEKLVEDDNTVLMEDDEEGETMLLGDEDDDSTLLGRNIVLLADDGTEYSGYCIEKVSLGRKKDCDIQILGDKAVSGIHCFILLDASGNLFVRDNSSANGTFINGEKIVMDKEILSGDIIQLGRYKYRVEVQ